MKLRNIVASFLAVVAMAVSCVDEFSGDLSSIKLDQSTIVLPEQGGSVTITINAVTDWSVDAATVPAEVTINPMSGKAGETKMTISTNGGSLNDIASDIVILVGKQKQFIKFYQPGDPSLKPQFDEFTEGEYWIMAKEGDEWFALKSTGLGLDDNSYGYIYSVPATVSEDGSLSSTASNVFTFEAVDGGFVIKDPNGGYLYQAAKYHNFYLTADKSKAAVWTVSQISDDEFMLEIPDLSKWMQYSTSYDSAGAYPTAQEGATLPKLVKAEDPAVEPFVIEQTEFTLPIEAGELMIPVVYNGNDIHIDELPSWLTFYGYHEGALKFTYEENTGGKRDAVVVLTTCMEDGRECEVELTFTQEGSIQDMTVADFLASEEGAALYRLTGKVANLQAGDYGNFDLVDATGSVYVYGLTATPVEKNDKSFPSLGIKEGDIVTLVGTRASFGGTAQVGGPAYYVSHEGHTESTVADFLAQPVGDAWYKLTGTITNLKTGNYGNFDLVDETGSVYVYGLTVAPVAKNDQSFPNLGLKEGDVVTLIGKRAEYNGASQVGGPAYYISHVAAAEGGDDNTGNEGGEATETFASNVTFGTVSSAYTDGVATVNGVENVATLKLGTSKLYGEGTITLPAGTTKVTYYAVAWKNNPSKLEFSVGGTVAGTQEIAANDGATSVSPYTITVADTDKYTFTLSSALETETVVTVKTVETGYRAIIFGVVAE